MSRHGRGATWLTLVGVLSVGACHGDGPIAPPPLPPPPPPLREVVVSNPVTRTSSGAARPAIPLALAATAETTYVSLPPGTAPGGDLATIRNLRTASSVVAPVGDGGFDPVPLSAVAGDTIEVVVRDQDGTTVLSVRAAVAAKRPPILIRTNPASLKRDVPLNASIVIVFSEPIDSASVTGETVQLRRGSVIVDGEARFRDSAHTTVVFTPAALLAPATTYDLVITQGIRDLDGEPLEAAVSVEFTTVTTGGGYQEFFVDCCQILDAHSVGDSVHVSLTAQVIDGTGAGVEGAVIRFRASMGGVEPDPTISELDGFRSAQWTFMGTMGSPGPQAELSACASNSTTRCDMYWPILTIGVRLP
jgi:hypothetical protein